MEARNAMEAFPWQKHGLNPIWRETVRKAILRKTGVVFTWELSGKRYRAGGTQYVLGSDACPKKTAHFALELRVGELL